MAPVLLLDAAVSLGVTVVGVVLTTGGLEDGMMETPVPCGVLEVGLDGSVVVPVVIATPVPVVSTLVPGVLDGIGTITVVPGPVMVIPPVGVGKPLRGGTTPPVPMGEVKIGGTNVVGTGNPLPTGPVGSILPTTPVGLVKMLPTGPVGSILPIGAVGLLSILPTRPDTVGSTLPKGAVTPLRVDPALLRILEKPEDRALTRPGSVAVSEICDSFDWSEDSIEATGLVICAGSSVVADSRLETTEVTSELTDDRIDPALLVTPGNRPPVTGPEIPARSEVAPATP